MLDSLVLRDFLARESRSTISGEDALRFKHVLIRDVAYGGVSKGARADLHEGFAVWLAERGVDELIEIRAYHLDQAVSLLQELDAGIPRELWTTRLRCSKAPAAAPCSARPTARRASCSSGRWSSRRHSSGGSWPRARLAAQRPADRGRRDGGRSLGRSEAGNRAIEGRAVTALADIALLRDADLPRGRELAERALTLLEDAGPEARFDALEQRAYIGWWLGELDDYDPYLNRALAIAQEAGRVDLEATATGSLAGSALARLDIDRGEELAARSLELADASSNHVRAGMGARRAGPRRQGPRAAEHGRGGVSRGGRRFSEVGAGWAHARAVSVWPGSPGSSGDLGLAERRFREAIRILTPMEDRGALCESQRALAQLLVERGEIEEAERWALEARKTVGPHDMASQASTRMALGIVRAAQGRDEEAERCSARRWRSCGRRSSRT